MNFTEILNKLQTLSIEQRHLLISHALQLDELPLSAKNEALIEERLAAHRQNPPSSVPLGEMKTRLQNRLQK